MTESYNDGGHKVTNELGWMKEATGKEPAMLGFDLALLSKIEMGLSSCLLSPVVLCPSSR